MRSILCFDRGSGLQGSSDPQIKYKVWSKEHLEIEFQVPEAGRYPVLHCILRPGDKLLLGGSFEDKLDFIFGLSFFEFDNLDMVCPKVAHLLENTHKGKRHDGFVTRAIEPYSGKVHWFLLTEIGNPGPTAFSVSTANSFFRDGSIKSNSMSLVVLGDELLDDMQPSAWRSIWQGVKKGVGMYASHKAGGLVEHFIYKPKLIEAMEKVNEAGEKIEKYRASFLKSDLYDVFTK